MDDGKKAYDAQQQRTSHREAADTSSSQGSPRAAPYASHGALIDRSQTAELNSRRVGPICLRQLYMLPEICADAYSNGHSL